MAPATGLAIIARYRTIERAAAAPHIKALVAEIVAAAAATPPDA